MRVSNRSEAGPEKGKAKPLQGPKSTKGIEAMVFAGLLLSTVAGYRTLYNRLLSPSSTSSTVVTTTESEANPETRSTVPSTVNTSSDDQAALTNVNAAQPDTEVSQNEDGVGDTSALTEQELRTLAETEVRNMISSGKIREWYGNGKRREFEAMIGHLLHLDQCQTRPEFECQNRLSAALIAASNEVMRHAELARDTHDPLTAFHLSNLVGREFYAANMAVESGHPELIVESFRADTMDMQALIHEGQNIMPVMALLTAEERREFIDFMARMQPGTEEIARERSARAAQLRADGNLEAALEAEQSARRIQYQADEYRRASEIYSGQSLARIRARQAAEAEADRAAADAEEDAEERAEAARAASSEHEPSEHSES